MKLQPLEVNMKVKCNYCGTVRDSIQRGLETSSYPTDCEKCGASSFTPVPLKSEIFKKKNEVAGIQEVSPVAGVLSAGVGSLMAGFAARRRMRAEAFRAMRERKRR